MLPNNAIAWAQFQLNGAWRNTIVFGTVYAAAIIGLFAIASRLDPLGLGRGSAWIAILMAIQTAGLLLYAGSRIGMAIRNDINSRMIESHRLMPVSSSHAIIGYLVGGASQGLVLVGLNFLIGIVVCAVSSLQLDRWILRNAVLLVFAGFVWTMLALLAFTATRGRGGVGWIIALLVLSASTGGMITAIVPAAAVLCSPLIGNSIYTETGGDAALAPIYGVSLIGQLCIGGLFFFAAARKYRGAARGFTPLAALLLLATVAGLTLYGAHQWPAIRPGYMSSMGDEDELRSIQLIASTIAMMLLALLAVSASARRWDRWKRLRDELGKAPSRRPIHPALMALLVSAVCFTLPLFIDVPATIQRTGYLLARSGLSDRNAALLQTAVLLVAFFFMAGYLFRFIHRLRWRAALPMGVVVLLLSIAPLLIDAALDVAGNRPGNQPLSWISGVSPVGAMLHLWGNTRADAAPGIAGLLVFAGLLAMLYHVLVRTSPHAAPSASLPEAT